MDSNQIRQSLRQERRTLSEEVQRKHAASVCAYLTDSQLAMHATHVAVYLAQDGELDLAPTIRHLWSLAVHVLVPIMNEQYMAFTTLRPDTDLKRSRLGIDEPIERTPIDLQRNCIALCPGVVFTKSGDRIGRGGGYYDKYFSAHDCMLKIGVAHSFQIVDNVARKKHDIQMDAVLSDQGWAYVSTLAQKYLNL